MSISYISVESISVAEVVAEKIPKPCISVYLCGYVSILLECKSTVYSGKFAFYRRKPPRSDSERFVVWWSRGESKPPAVVAAVRESVFVAEIVAEWHSFISNLS